MNREIKFRARHKQTGEWYYGTNQPLDMENPDGFLWPLNLFWLEVEHGLLDKETVGQYTGRKDKNGTEIYEGNMKAEEYLCDSYGHDCLQLKTCAEISFKAGQKEEKDSWLLKTDPEKTRDAFTKDIILKVRAQAIKEMMEWIEQYECSDEDCVKWKCFEADGWETKKAEMVKAILDGKVIDND